MHSVGDARNKEDHLTATTDRHRKPRLASGIVTIVVKLTLTGMCYKSEHGFVSSLASDVRGCARAQTLFWNVASNESNACEA